MFSLHFVLPTNAAAAFIGAKTKSNLKLTLIDDLILISLRSNDLPHSLYSFVRTT